MCDSSASKCRLISNWINNALIPYELNTQMIEAYMFMQTIIRFGGKLTDIGRECTHIVSPRVTRTVKFLSGISVCRHIVTPEWVEECGRVGRLVDESNYVLQDRDAEEIFEMNVATSLARARNKKLLMVTIYNVYMCKVV